MQKNSSWLNVHKQIIVTKWAYEETPILTVPNHHPPPLQFLAGLYVSKLIIIHLLYMSIDLDESQNGEVTIDTRNQE